MSTRFQRVAINARDNHHLVNRPSIPLTLMLLVLLSAVQFEAFGDESVPAGMVTFFESKNCPTGWVEPEYARGRLLMYGDRNDASRPRNKPMLAGQAPRHHHTSVLAGVTLDEKYVQGVSGCTNNSTVNAGQYSLVGPSSVDEAEAGLPFIHMTACERKGPDKEYDPLPIGTFGFFNRHECPMEWEVCKPPVCKPFSGRFALPVMQGGTVGHYAGEAWEDERFGVHSHRLSGELKLESVGLTWFIGGNNRAKSGQPKFAGEVLFPPKNSDGSHGVLPYVRFLGCVKTGLEEVAEKSRSIPDGMTIFYAGEKNCPTNWQPANAKTAGRFIVASPQGANSFDEFGAIEPVLRDGDAPAHTHDYRGQFILPGSNICLNGGGPENLAKSGTYNIKGKVDAGRIDPPFIQLRHCTYYAE